MNRKKPIASSGSRTKRAPAKRNMFTELMEGLQALEDQRLGKRTLRTHDVILRKTPEVTPADLVKLRERLALSRPVFADYLRTNPRTLENWEQGRAKPNAQAALLISLVDRYPDTVQRLARAWPGGRRRNPAGASVRASNGSCIRALRTSGMCSGTSAPSLRMRAWASNGAWTFTSLSK